MFELPRGNHGIFANSYKFNLYECLHAKLDLLLSNVNSSCILQLWVNRFQIYDIKPHNVSSVDKPIGNCISAMKGTSTSFQTVFKTLYVGLQYMTYMLW